METLKECGITHINGVDINDVAKDDIMKFIAESEENDYTLFNCIHTKSKIIFIDNSDYIKKLATTHQIEEIYDIVKDSTRNELVCMHISYILQNTYTGIDDEGIFSIVRIYNDYAIKMPYFSVDYEAHEDHEDNEANEDHEDYEAHEANEDHEAREDHDHDYLRVRESIMRDAIIGCILSGLTEYTPKYYGLFYCKDPFSIMEYIKGMLFENYRKYILDRLSPHNVELIFLSLFKRIIIFLYKAYELYKFIHCDLHGKNIMITNVENTVDNNGIITYGIKPVIIDFGSSFIFKESSVDDFVYTNEQQLSSLCSKFLIEYTFTSDKYPEMLKELYVKFLES